MKLTRRHFLKMMGVSSAGAMLFYGCGFPRRELFVQSPASLPEDLVTGVDNWYSSLCRQCPAGCGIMVRVMEGRAKKVEGNPDYPLNLGKLCARGQAEVQALYHPDRIQGPLRFVGERGAGRFQPVSWDNALDELGARLRELQDKGEQDGLLVLTEPLRSHLALVVKRFVKAYGGEHWAYDSLEEDTVLRAACQRVFGQEGLPAFNIKNTRFLLSFGADFLGTWLSPVHYSYSYGEFRQGRPERGVFVQIEPRFSHTAASADRWLPINPGTEGLLALSLAYVIASQGLGEKSAVDALTKGEGAAALEAFAPEKVSTACGLSEGAIRELARDFATHRPSLAIGGGPAAAQTNGLFNLSSILALNFLVGSVGERGGVLFNPPTPFPKEDITARATPFGQWGQLAERLRTGRPSSFKVVMVHGVNPVYSLPRDLAFLDALREVPLVVSFSSFLDETTTQAHLILPDHVPLETWGNELPDPGPGYPVVGWQQPVVTPLHDTRSFPDVLLTLAEELGEEMRQALPWNTFREVLRDGAAKLQALGRGSIKEENSEAFWQRLLQRGGWWDGETTVSKAVPPPPPLPREALKPTFSGDAPDFPFHLLVFPSLSLGDGRGAHLPWLQATQDPVTTVVWNTWVEINPGTAREMAIKEGDILSVASPFGEIEAPAYPNPTTPPGVIAMPSGQGHSVYGRYGRGRGVNPLSILAPATERETGALAWGATRVRIRKTGQYAQLAKIEGSVPAIQLPDFELYKVVRRK